MGSHQLDFYKGSQVVLGPKIIGYEVTSEQEGVLERAINATDDSHAVCVIETDEECYYDFTATPAGAEAPFAYRIRVTTEDQAPTGATSEFDRLLIEHMASANGDNVNARVELATSRATDYEIWAIDGEDSYHPVVLGPDYLNYGGNLSGLSALCYLATNSCWTQGHQLRSFVRRQNCSMLGDGYRRFCVQIQTKPQSPLK